MYTFYLENLKRTAHMEHLGVVRAQSVIRGRTEWPHKAPKFGGRGGIGDESATKNIFGES